jgi:glutamate--cysteine ligase
LLHCLLQPSPPDTPEEIQALGDNQHRTAAYGRQPGLRLQRGQRDVVLVEWAAELLAQCAPIAQALDAAHGHAQYSQALAAARAALDAPHTLPSARVLTTMQSDFGGSHNRFVDAQSEQTRQRMLALPWTPAQQAAFAAAAEQSIEQMRAIEAADTQDFETFRRAYLAPERLQVAAQA